MTLISTDHFGLVPAFDLEASSSAAVPTLGIMAMKYREVRRALRSAGWSSVRQSGSHEIWQGVDGKRVVTVAGKNSDTVPAGTLAAMRRATGLETLR